MRANAACHTMDAVTTSSPQRTSCGQRPVLFGRQGWPFFIHAERCTVRRQDHRNIPHSNALVEAPPFLTSEKSERLCVSVAAARAGIYVARPGKLSRPVTSL
jgi:hypothetical protein